MKHIDAHSIAAMPIGRSDRRSTALFTGSASEARLTT